jgi:enamine deaminase RidA (YjgF/YER057c/UK114 family)
MRVLQPEGWMRPSGYSNGIAAQGRLVFVSGMIGCDGRGRLVATDLCGQVRQILLNITKVLAEAGAKPEHIVRMNWFVLSKREYIGERKRIGEVYRAILGAHYPAMTAVEVSCLVEDGALVEIEATAVVPE